MKPVFLAGPTAVGKSAVALHLAEQVGGEILTVDSMQVYRGLDIGTAKPSPADRQKVPHHLLDLVAANESFDVAKWWESAKACLQSLRQRNSRPVFCGGTGLYFKVWFRGLEAVPPADPALRAQLEQMSLDTLLAELATQDPETYRRIDQGNRRRVVRAVEMVRLSGRPLRHPWPMKEAAGGDHVIVMQRRSDDLRRRIEMRVDAMLKAGLAEETQRLLRIGLDRNRTAMQALGYRQMVEYLRGERDWQATSDLIKTKTWHFARRQATWFRHQLPVRWLEVPPDEPAPTTAQRVLALVDD